MPDSIRNWQRLLMGMLLVMGLVPTHANGMSDPQVYNLFCTNPLVFC